MSAVATRLGLGLMGLGLLLAYGVGSGAYLWILLSLFHHHAVLAWLWLIPGMAASLGVGTVLAAPLQLLGAVLLTRGRGDAAPQDRAEIGVPRLSSTGETS